MATLKKADEVHLQDLMVQNFKWKGEESELVISR